MFAVFLYVSKVGEYPLQSSALAPPRAVACSRILALNVFPYGVHSVPLASSLIPCAAYYKDTSAS